MNVAQWRDQGTDSPFWISTSSSWRRGLRGDNTIQEIADRASRSRVSVMASMSAAFTSVWGCRHLYLSFRYLRPPWKTVSDGRRPAIEKRIVPDGPTDPDSGSGDVRMRTVETAGANGRVKTRLRRSRPVPSESGFLVHAPAGAPDPALFRPPGNHLPEVCSGLLARRLVGD